MEKRKKSLQIQPRALVIFFLLIIPLLVVGPLVLLSDARDTNESATKRHLSQMADQAQMALSDYLQRLIIQVASLSAVPDLQQRVQAANRTRLGPQEITQRTESIEKLWAGMIPQNSEILREILENPVSQFLRLYQYHSRSFREIIITDLNGRLVAASGKPTDYYQADEAWWQQAYRDGSGGHFISDVYLDPSVNTYAIEVAEPIITPGSYEVIGVLKVVVDIQEMSALVTAIDVGRPLLTRGDGMILISRDFSLADQRQYPHQGQVNQAVEAGRFWLDVGAGAERVLVGLPHSRLQRTFPALEWYLIIEESYDSAMAHFTTLNKNFLYLLVFGLGLIIVLSFGLNWVLSRPVIETDPHLEQL